MQDVKRELVIDRIKEGLALKGIKPKPAAIAMGLSETAILDIIKGRSQNPKRNTLQKIADYFDWPIDYLLGAEDVSLPVNGGIPEYDVEVSAGYGALNESNQRKGQWVVPDYFLPKNNSEFGVVAVRGDSMSPQLDNGDRVLIDFRDDTPSPPGLFVVHDGMSDVVKRVEYVMGSNPPRVRLLSVNTAYQNYEFSLDEVRIIGRVKLIIRKVG